MLIDVVLGARPMGAMIGEGSLARPAAAGSEEVPAEAGGRFGAEVFGGAVPMRPLIASKIFLMSIRVESWLLRISSVGLSPWV